MWMTGAASDILSEMMGPDDSCCGQDSEGDQLAVPPESRFERRPVPHQRVMMMMMATIMNMTMMTAMTSDNVGNHDDDDDGGGGGGEG